MQVAVACASPLVTEPNPTATAAPPAASIPPATTPSGSPAPTPAPSSSLAPIAVRDIGPEGWIAITTDTNSGIARTEILGTIRSDFGYVFTCTGIGTATVRLSATSTRVADASKDPTLVRAWTSECPTTAVGTDSTGRLDGGAYSISPAVTVPDGVTYRLLVATLPK